MSAGAPWSVKGIDPKAREAAKDLARRSGMTLGEWLNRMILEEDGPEDVTSQSFFDRPRGGYGVEPAIKRFEAPEHPADDVGRVVGALDSLSLRIEAAEARAASAIGGVELQVRGALERLQLAERDKVSVAARFEGLADELGDGQSRLLERVHRLEQAASGPKSVEALRSLETALGKVANHLYEAESRTRQRMVDVEVRLERMTDPAAMQAMIDEVVARAGERLEQAESRTTETLGALQASFAALDQRLTPIERADGAGRLEQLAAGLTQRMETARVEMAEQLRAAADGRFERLENKLGEMSEHVRKAEHTSAQAIERMGREVVQIAETLNRRVGEVETRGVQAAQKAGDDMARLTQSIDQRFARIDQSQADTLTRLSGEISKITERLSERIGGAERRSAAAVDDISEQVARITERFNERQERVSDDMGARIRQSEERTARLLDEARDRIERRLSDTDRRAAPPQAAAWASAPGLEPTPSFGPDVLSELAPPPRGDGPFASPATAEGLGGDELFDTPFGKARAAALSRQDLDPEPRIEAPDAAFDDPFETDDQFETAGDATDPFADKAFVEPLAETAIAPTAPEEVAPTPDPAPIVAEAPVEPRPVAAPEVEVSEPASAAPEAVAPEPAEPPAEPRALTTREIIEQARASARAASGLTAAQEAPSLLGGQPAKRVAGRRVRPSTQTAALVFAGGVALGLGAVGYSMKDNQPTLPKRVADQIALARGGGEVKGGEVDPSKAPPAPPRLSMALTPRETGSPTPRLAPPAQTAKVDPGALYTQAVGQIEAHDAKGAETLRKVANLGYAPAQFYLAKLYETGGDGVKKNLEEARRWTQRAAEGGERKAMHNLALYYFEGAGGPKDAATAAQWFRKAADLGLVDSQHNLGRLYEEGYGVQQNAAEAYKWYLVAGRTGDEESRASAARVRAQLSAQAQSTAERSATAYRASGTGGVQTAQAGVSAVTAQRALAKLGYYQGPADGASSPALRLATAAYQRDQGLAATGALDAATLAKLAAFTR